VSVEKPGQPALPEVVVELRQFAARPAKNFDIRFFSDISAIYSPPDNMAAWFHTFTSMTSLHPVYTGSRK